MHPIIQTAVSGNLYFHQMHFRRSGEYIPTHAHAYDHVLHVVRGRLKVATDTEVTEVGANQFFEVPLGKEHGLMALEDDTFAQCVHVMRFPDGAIIPFSYETSPIERLEITRAL